MYVSWFAFCKERPMETTLRREMPFMAAVVLAILGAILL